MAPTSADKATTASKKGAAKAGEGAQKENTANSKEMSTKRKESTDNSKKTQDTQGWTMKAVLLAVLSIQHCLVGIITNQSRNTGSGKFLPQTGVICQEIVKGVFALSLVVRNGESLVAIFSNPLELARSSIPALLYLVQNNLQYVALKYLDPATYVVTYQLKILSTALMSVLLLKRVLSVQKWAALVLLVVGVSTVQLSAMSASEGTDKREGSYSYQTLGLAAVLTTCALSGLAGVYTEMILKSSSVTLWARNVQLSVVSLVIAALGLVFTGDMEKVQAHGFFQGYNAWACAAIINNSFGGLLIAVIIKYADNIIKNFATAISIVLTTAASIYALGMTFTTTFFAGIATVCCSTFLYGGAFDDLLKLLSGGEDRAKKQK